MELKREESGVQGERRRVSVSVSVRVSQRKQMRLCVN